MRHHSFTIVHIGILTYTIWVKKEMALIEVRINMKWTECIYSYCFISHYLFIPSSLFILYFCILSPCLHINITLFYNLFFSPSLLSPFYSVWKIKKYSAFLSSFPTLHSSFLFHFLSSTPLPLFLFYLLVLLPLFPFYLLVFLPLFPFYLLVLFPLFPIYLLVLLPLFPTDFNSHHHSGHHPWNSWQRFSTEEASLISLKHKEEKEKYQ